MRKISITITDELGGKPVSIKGEINMDSLKELSKKHGINGLTDLLIQLNVMLNEEMGTNVDTGLKSDMTNLPDGKKW